HIPLLLSQMLHLTAAGAWPGGLLPGAGGTARCCASCRPALVCPRYHLSRRACRHRASSGALLSGGLAGLTGTAYGAVLLLKAVLFAVLIAIAAVNHFRLTPAFAGPDASGVCREPAQQPRAWNAYGVGIRSDGDTEMTKRKMTALAALCVLLGSATAAMVEESLSTQAYEAAMGKMHQGMMIEYSGDADID